MLKQRSMARVRIREQDGVGKVLDQSVRVRDRDHVVVTAIYDKGRLLDTPQVGEPRPTRLLPLTERRDLCRGDVRSRRRVEIFCSPCQPLDERSPGRLAGSRRREKDLLQDGGALEL